MAELNMKCDNLCLKFGRIRYVISCHIYYMLCHVTCHHIYHVTSYVMSHVFSHFMSCHISQVMLHIICHVIFNVMSCHEYHYWRGKVGYWSCLCCYDCNSFIGGEEIGYWSYFCCYGYNSFIGEGRLVIGRVYVGMVTIRGVCRGWISLSSTQ